MKLLLAGAGGMLGTDVLLAAAARGHEFVGLRRAELDVTDRSAVSERVLAEQPDAVLNCAAWTDVDGAEAEPGAAREVNVAGARNVAEAAAAAGAVVVYVSTDYVFAGDRDRPWVESDQTAPLSVYGRTKLEGEHATRDANSRHVIARTAWLYGPAGGNFVATMLRLAAEREQVEVVDDQIGCPTYTGHLAPALLDLAAGTALGVHHVAGSGACSWFDFAVEIFQRAGADCRAVPCATADTDRPAPRPRWSVLASERPDTPRLPAWQDGLTAYFARKAVAA